MGAEKVGTGDVGVWQEVEITLTAERDYPNPYTDVMVWVDLSGPGFQKRCYGFWDGGRTFHVRVTATVPGTWRWRSGSAPADGGLDGQAGEFTARPWSEAEIVANPNRRGIIRATPNGHALQYADGEPFFLMGDTWWAAPSYRFPWHDDDQPRPVGPEWGFKDMVRLRKDQGFNSIAILAAHPAWANDGKPAELVMEDGTTIRSAWKHPGTGSAKDMHNEGRRPFEFPGKVPGFEEVYPDVDRINPAYFQAMDRKIAYLCEQGFVPFIEVLRRDASMPWRKFHDWPESYARYVQYVWSRYQALNVILSPIHFDWLEHTIHPREYNVPANLVIDHFGPPPFGNLVSANASPSTLAHFGSADEATWLTMHQIGNWRDHDHYWYLTEVYHDQPARPALNGEPYYDGLDIKGQLGAGGGTEVDDRWTRSGMYGSFLSGGLAGHIYGAEGIWGADIENEARLKMWDAFQWNSANMARPFVKFVFSEGLRYRELAPEANLIVPSRTDQPAGYDGWAYAARTPDRGLFMLYFEKGCKPACLRGGLHDATYKAQWYDVRTGEWIDAGLLKASCVERIDLPNLPSDDDWAMKLTLVE